MRYGQPMGLFRRRKRDLFTIPEPSPPSATGFRMVVADVFFITGRGVVVTGTVEAGTIRVGNQVAIERDGQSLHTVEVRAIEQFRKMRNEATAGENVGLLLPGLSRDDIAGGDTLSG